VAYFLLGARTALLGEASGYVSLAATSDDCCEFSLMRSAEGLTSQKSEDKVVTLRVGATQSGDVVLSCSRDEPRAQMMRHHQ
jgi:hypothetical protein